MFVGRKKELKQLSEYSAQKKAKVIVLTGRRRVGKSSLIKYFGENQKKAYYELIGQPPGKNNRKSAELANISQQISATFNTHRPMLTDWEHALNVIGECVKGGNCILVIDEINWFGKTALNISESLFTLWESKLKMLPSFTLILTGSLAGWIDDNFSKSTAWYGRIMWQPILQPLSLSEALSFIPLAKRKRMTPWEQLSYSMVAGGIPQYLEVINYSKTIEDNLVDLAYSSSGYLFNEYEQLMRELFRAKRTKINKILALLGDKNCSADEIARGLSLSKANGDLYADLAMMEKSFFIDVEEQWDITDNKLSTRNKKYYLSDPYLRFYHKAILPHKNKIEKSVATLPKNLESLLGFQFEYVVRQNIDLVFKILGVNHQDVEHYSPYSRRGIQIDLLIQTRRFFYIVELKFKKGLLDASVVSNMIQKMDRFNATQKSRSIKTAIIHAGGVEDCVSESEYIDVCENIID
ncbi:MAG: ATP-binding protein [Psychrosphaera sp.]|nr:ATP-binding protein [Psychrosphaera sp.]